MSDLRPIDYNGHVPDTPAPPRHAQHWSVVVLVICTTAWILACLVATGVFK